MDDASTCLVCGTGYVLESHHVAGIRNHSGLTVSLCRPHHRLVHRRLAMSGVDLRARDPTRQERLYAVTVGTLEVLLLAYMASGREALIARAARARSVALMGLRPGTARATFSPVMAANAGAGAITSPRPGGFDLAALDDLANEAVEAIAAIEAASCLELALL